MVELRGGGGEGGGGGGGAKQAPEGVDWRSSSERVTRCHIAPEGRHFFKIVGRRLIVKRTFVNSLSSIASFDLTFTFWGGMRVKISSKSFQSY